MILTLSVSEINAQCVAVTGGSGNAPALSLPSCGSYTGYVYPPRSGYATLNSLQAGGRYRVEITNANRITVRTSPTAGSVIASCTSCTNLTFDAPSAGTYYVVVNQGSCPGTWSTTSASLRYRRETPTAVTPTVTYNCTNVVLAASGNGTSYQWQGTGGVNVSGATSSTYTITSSSSPQYATYRLRSFLGSCSANGSYVDVVPMDNYTGNIVISSNVTLGGVHDINGDFTINSGVTVTTKDGCVLEINANNITVAGSINGNGRGSNGGGGGARGTFYGNCGSESGSSVSGGRGSGGSSGAGSGGGSGGSVGGNASGRHRNCGGFLCSGNYAGYYPGAGGAGGGKGGGYGGNGANAGSGAQGTGIGGWNGGSGGSGASGGGGTYGSSNGTDITIGSGGGGAGGGGTGRNNASNGTAGGDGGGGVALNASNNLTVTGSILMNGNNGGNGGNGGTDSNGSYSCGSAPSCGDCSICGDDTYNAQGGAGAGAGGGSGGGIKLSGYGNVTVTGTLQARGGNGGSRGNPTSSNGSCNANAGSGGGGGGGRIKIFYNPCNANTISPSVSINGGTGNSTGSSGTYIAIAGFITPGGSNPTANRYIWTGASDTNWGNTSNWVFYNGSTWSTGVLPGSTNDVIIPGVTCAPNQPTISSSYSVRTLEIESTDGAEVTINCSNCLNITQ